LRKRYIALEVIPPPSRRELVRIIRLLSVRRGIDEEAVRLITLREGQAVVLCPNTLKDEVVDMLNCEVEGHRCRTLLTSGTLKALREKTQHR